MKRKSGEMEKSAEKNRTAEQKEGERKPKKRRKENGTDDIEVSGEKRAKKGKVDENRQKVKDRQVKKKSRGQTDSKKNVGVFSVSYSSTMDLIYGEKNKMRADRKEVDECNLVLRTHTETDRKKSRGERDECSDGDQHVSWVQCSNPECGKWRKLSDNDDPAVLPDDWTCQNNTDTAFSSCSAPEEKSSVPEEKMVFFSLVPGSLVWARQSGYPWWPAIVERDPNTEEFLEFRTKSDLTPYKCHVTYFGEPVTRAWVVCSRVRDYSNLSEDKLHNVKVDESLKASICMSKEALKLSLKERLVKFGFHSRYVSDQESSEDSDIAEMMELFSGKAENDFSDEDSWSKKQKRSTERKQRDLTDQTVPQGAMETRTDMTFDLDIHSDGEEKKKKCRGREKDKRSDEGRHEDDEEYKDAGRFSIIFQEEE